MGTVQAEFPPGRSPRTNSMHTAAVAGIPGLPYPAATNATGDQGSTMNAASGQCTEGHAIDAEPLT